MTDKAKLRDDMKKLVRSLLLSAPMGLTVREFERDFVSTMGYKIPALELGFKSTQDLLLDMEDACRAVWEAGHLVLYGVADKTTKHIQALVSKQKKDKKKSAQKRDKVNRGRPHTAPRYQNSYQYPQQRSFRGNFGDSRRQSGVSWGFSRQNESRSNFTRENYQNRNNEVGFSSTGKYKPPHLRGGVPANLQNQIKAILSDNGRETSNIEFDQIYQKRYSYNLNYNKFGFESLWELLREVPGVSTSHTSKDTYNIFLVKRSVNAVPAGYEQSNNKGSDEDNFKFTPFKPEKHVSYSKAVQNNSSHATSHARSLESSSRTRLFNHRPRTDDHPPSPTSSEKKNPISRLGPIRNSRTSSGPKITPSRTSPRSPRDRLRKDAKSSESIYRSSSAFENTFLKEIQEVLSKHPDGLGATNLPGEYKKLTGKSMSFFNMGYYSVIELVSAMPEIVTVEREDIGDWKLYDARIRAQSVKKSAVQEEEAEETNANVEDRSDLALIKYQLKTLLQYHADGVPLSELEGAYFEKFKKKVPLAQLGYHDIDSLVLLMPDVVKVVYQDQGIPFVYPEHNVNTVPAYDTSMASLFSLPQDAVGYGHRYRDLLLPKLNEYFEVYVSTVYSPHKFSVQFRDKDMNTALENMMDDLEAVYNYSEGDKYFMPNSMIAINQLCCALYHEDSNWHRAIITGVIPNGLIEVYYVDYGSILQVPKSCLRLLKACFLKLPAIAVDGRLANIAPVEEKWSSACRDRMLQATTEKPLIAYCTDIKDKVMTMYLCDTTTDMDIHIHEMLVKEGYAKSVEPEEDERAKIEVGPGVLTKSNMQQLDPSNFLVSMDQMMFQQGFTQPAYEPAAALLLSMGAEDEVVISQMNQELDGLDLESESSLDEIDENVPSNLNMDDIQMTMKFLDGRRKRLLESLSGKAMDAGVVDELEETETLMTHFKTRLATLDDKKQVEEQSIPDAVSPKSPREAEFTNQKQEQQAEVSPEVTIPPPSPTSPAQEASENQSQGLLMAAAKPMTLRQAIMNHNKNVEGGDHVNQGLLPGGTLTIENPLSPESQTLRAEEAASHSEQELDFSQTYEIENPQPLTVLKSDLKSLGQAIRSCLKVSAEPFKPKQTAAVSPMRKQESFFVSANSPSAFLNHTDALREKVVADPSSLEEVFPQGGEEGQDKIQPGQQFEESEEIGYGAVQNQSLQYLSGEGTQPNRQIMQELQSRQVVYEQRQSNFASQEYEQYMNQYQTNPHQQMAAVGFGRGRGGSHITDPRGDKPGPSALKHDSHFQMNTDSIELQKGDTGNFAPVNDNILPGLDVSEPSQVMWSNSDGDNHPLRNVMDEMSAMKRMIETMSSGDQRDIPLLRPEPRRIQQMDLGPTESHMMRNGPQGPALMANIPMKDPNMAKFPFGIPDSNSQNVPFGQHPPPGVHQMMTRPPMMHQFSQGPPGFQHVRPQPTNVPFINGPVNIPPMVNLQNFTQVNPSARMAPYHHPMNKMAMNSRMVPNPRMNPNSGMSPAFGVQPNASMNPNVFMSQNLGMSMHPEMSQYSGMSADIRLPTETGMLTDGRMPTDFKMLSDDVQSSVGPSSIGMVPPGQGQSQYEELSQMQNRGFQKSNSSAVGRGLGRGYRGQPV